MRKPDQKLIELFKKYGEDPSNCLWDCHGTWVAYHAAVERMAAKANIKFGKPDMIVNDPASKTVVVCVEAEMGEKSEWSFGEVSPSNNKNSYPYAMAEKRAKDRVALKLLGMAGLVYSEEEADDFKVSRPSEEAPPPAKSSAALKRTDENGDDAWSRLISDLQKDFVDCKSAVALSKLRADYRERARNERWPRTWLEALGNEFDTFEDKLSASAEQQILDDFPGSQITNETVREQSTLEAG